MINLFEFDNHIIDTSTFDHYLHGKIVQEFENQICEYVGAKYAASFFSASYAIYSIIKSKVINTPEIFSIPSMIPAVVPNSIIDAGSKITFTNDITWVGNSYKLCDGVIDSAQKLNKNQFRDECLDDDLLIFSMYPTKPLPSLDGGVVVSNNKEKIEDLKSLSFYGMEYEKNSWSRKQKQVGFKAYMSTLQATIASRNLNLLDEKYEIIDTIREKYNKELDLNNTSRHLYRIWVKDNEKSLDFFQKKGVVCGIHYKPQHTNPIFGANEFDEKLHLEVTIPSKKTLSIPLHKNLTKNEVDYIIETVKIYND